IYMYYGNPEAESASDGHATFDFFDDFEYSDSPAAHGWSVDGSALETSTERAKRGHRSLKLSPSEYAWVSLRLPVATNKLAVEVDYCETDPNELSVHAGLWLATSPAPRGSWSDAIIDAFPWVYNHYNYKGVINGRGAISSVRRTAGWHLFTNQRDGTTASSLVDGVVVPESVYSTSAEIVEVGLASGSPGGYSGWSSVRYYDSFRVRKYTTPEPTTSVGAEEAVSRVPSTTQIGKLAPDAWAGVDTLPPTSSVDPIEPYWQNAKTVPFEVTATAGDLIPPNGAVPSGLKQVELFYRYSSDNSSWSPWISYDVDETPPWSWSFTAPKGDGFYEFSSTAVDIAGNVEDVAPLTDSRAAVDTFAPQSSVDPLDCWQLSLPFEITATAADVIPPNSAVPSGVAEVLLWYRHSFDNETWSNWVFFGADRTPPYSWSFNAPAGYGFYEVYT
ncbi:MAG: DUF2341 domain-containing protein, partial [Candidatus Hadarchaeales archaeon]